MTNSQDKQLRIIRVFPRKTKATPVDDMAFVGEPPLQLPEADEVHISVTFTWHKALAEHLAASWGQHYGCVKIGGPAYDDPGGDFEPGMYLKPGYVITTRGCPNRCGYCFVPEREGMLRELKIRNGYDVLDNNLLAASRRHIGRVLDMLAAQTHAPRLTGGLEARRVEPWFAKALKPFHAEIGFLAYDRPGDRKHVADAAKLLLPCFSTRRLGCYVLCGYEGDTIDAARERCQFVAELGMMPFPMYYRPKGWHGRVPSGWRDWVRRNSRGVPDREPETASDDLELFTSRDDNSTDAGEQRPGMAREMTLPTASTISVSAPPALPGGGRR